MTPSMQTTQMKNAKKSQKKMRSELYPTVDKEVKGIR